METIYNPLIGAKKQCEKIERKRTADALRFVNLTFRKIKEPKSGLTLWPILVILTICIMAGCFIVKPAHAEMLSAHFSKTEFNQRQMPLPVNSIKVSPQLVEKLEKLRHICRNRPIVITSGYRSPSYNAKVGGVRYSQHMLGKAADIYVDGIDNRMLGNYARIVGFSFVKVYATHVHVDVR